MLSAAGSGLLDAAGWLLLAVLLWRCLFWALSVAEAASAAELAEPSA